MLDITDTTRSHHAHRTDGQRRADGRHDGLGGRFPGPGRRGGEIQREPGAPLVAEVIGFRDD